MSENAPPNRPDDDDEPANEKTPPELAIEVAAEATPVPEARTEIEASAELENADEPVPAGVAETLKDVGSRLPAYARLSQGLVAAGLISANQQADILGPLGYGPLARVARFVPLLSQLTRVLTLVGAIRFALTQLEPEVAEQHLAQVGLTRAQVEADFQATRNLAERAAEAGGQHAARALEVGSEIGSKVLDAGWEHAARAIEVAAPIANEKLHQGAKRAGRIAGLSVRAFRDWKEQVKSSSPAPPKDEGKPQS